MTVPGAIFTTLEDGTRVNMNIYASKLDVYLDGGPGPNAPQTAAGLPDGNYYFQVTDPSGKTLLSSDPVKCREFRVADGIIVEYVSAGRTYVRHNKVVPCAMDGKSNGMHDTGVDVDHGALTIQLMPYDNTPNKGGVYKAWATPTGQFVGDPENVDNPCGSGCAHGFVHAYSKTDNFKAKSGGGPPFTNPIINVLKFVDTDGDGVWDGGEPEVGVNTFIDGGGWPVHVTDPNEVTSDGFTPYSYLPGFAGAYGATEDVLNGWAQTAAYLDGVAQPVAPTVVVNVAYTSGETHTVIFGNFQCFDVSGYKVNDLNGNGVWDDGEPTIPGWPILLYRNGVLLLSTTTGADGSFTFQVCQGGHFEVREGSVDGWTSTGAASFSFDGTSGVDHGALVFLNFECFTVSGYKYDDTNGDGVHQDGEPGLAGWTIELVKDGQVVQTTTTGSDGSYSFEICAAGEYTVREVVQDGWVATGPTEYTFTASSGQDHAFNFLNFKLGQICGTKFYDANMNGAWDDGEPTIAGILVQLYRGGELIDSVYTDANGDFCFTGLTAGTYTVQEVLPNNPDATHVWVQTFPSSGQWTFTVTSGFSADDADIGNVCVFTEGLTWGYWKTHTGYDEPPRDAAYDLLPSNPMPVDVTTPDGNMYIDTDSEANWLFNGGAGDVNCSGDCRTLFRAQLLALWMNTLKFPDIGDQVYVSEGDPHSGDTVSQIVTDALALLNDGQDHDFTSFQETLNAINNNGEGTPVLVCDTPPTPNYS